VEKNSLALPYSYDPSPVLDGPQRTCVLRFRAMPTLALTHDELRDAAQAARLAAAQAQRDAPAQSNPRISAAFAADAQRYTALGEKFEAARHAPIAR